MAVSLTAATRTLAHAALNLHRLALAAEEISTTESPAFPLSAADRIARPTEHAALCERRAAVVTTANEVSQSLNTHTERLAQVLSEWEGQPTS